MRCLGKVLRRGPLFFMGSSCIVEVLFLIQQYGTNIFEPGNDVKPRYRVDPDRRFVAQHLVGIVRTVLKIHIQQIDIVQLVWNYWLVRCFRHD